MTRYLFATLFLIALSPAFAQMNYQGRLTDNTGAPLPDRPYNLEFNVYDSATEGNRVWGPYDALAVDLIDGRFNTIIGSTDKSGNLLADALNSDSPRFLQLTRLGSEPILPRQQILATPKALTADSAVKAVKLSNGPDIAVSALEGGGAYALDMRCGNLKVDQNLAVGWNMTLSGDLTADGNLTIDGSSNLDSPVGINQTWNGIALNVRGGSGQPELLNVEKADNTDVFKVDAEGRLSVNRRIHSDRTLSIKQAPGKDLMWLERSDGSNALAWDENGPNIHLKRHGVGPNESLSITSLYASEFQQWDIWVDTAAFDSVLAFSLHGNATNHWIHPTEGWNDTSDRRLKQDIERLDNCLDTVMRLKPSAYRWKDKKQEGLKSIGFIAQEVQEVLPELVLTCNDKLGLSYKGFGVVAIGAIQELKAEKDREIGALQNKNAALEASNATLQAKLTAMESQLSSLSQAVAGLQAESSAVAQN